MPPPITIGQQQPQQRQASDPVAFNAMDTAPPSCAPSASTATSPAAPPSSSPPAFASASPAAPQGRRRIHIRLKTNRSPLKDNSRGLTCDDIPRAKFIPGPNSNAPRNYDDLPESEQMATYVKENKELLAELVGFESEGYLARIDWDHSATPKHTPVNFRSEPAEDQVVLNDILEENYCLRLRCQCLREVKRHCRVGDYNGEEITMRLHKTFQFRVTFP